MDKSGWKLSDWKEDKNMENKNAMQPEKQAAIRILSKSEELYVLISLCTKMPFVMCDPETFDDEIFIYEKEEDIKREGKRFVDQKIPLQIAKVARRMSMTLRDLLSERRIRRISSAVRILSRATC